VIPQPYAVPVPAPRRPWYWEEWNRYKRPFDITYGGESVVKQTTIEGKTFNEHTPKLLSSSVSLS